MNSPNHRHSLLSRLWAIAIAGYAVSVLGADQRCSVPDALLRAKMMHPAEVEYARILHEQPGVPCAEQGLKAAGSEAARSLARTREAARFEAVGSDRQATAAYLDALGIDGSSGDAQAGLKRMLTTVPMGADRLNEFDQTRALAGMGFYSEATEKLKEALKKHPGMSVPPEFQYLSGGRIPMWRNVARSGTTWLRPAIEIAAVLYCGYLVSTMIRRRWLSRPALRIAEFTKDAGAVDAGKTVAMMVQDALAQFAVTQHTATLGIVTGDVETVPLPAQLTSTFPSSVAWVSSLAAALAVTQSRRIVQLTGHLVARGSRGPGLGVLLAERNAVFASEIIWYEDMYPNPAPSTSLEVREYQYLAEAAAVWVLYTLAERYE